MAQAMKCDRCGKLYESYSGAKEFRKSGLANALALKDYLNASDFYSRGEYDLCPGCMTKLIDFLSGGETDGN